MPGPKDRKTPGVFVTEMPAFPPSAVGVDTAVPAFVGYTEKADIDGRPMINTPIPLLAKRKLLLGGGLSCRDASS